MKKSILVLVFLLAAGIARAGIIYQFTGLDGFSSYTFTLTVPTFLQGTGATGQTRIWSSRPARTWRAASAQDQIFLRCAGPRPYRGSV